MNGLVLIALGALSIGSFGQAQPNPPPDIVESLMPAGNPRNVAKLSAGEQSLATKRLAAEQATATGKKARRIAFLLAAFGSDYGRNRDYLIDSLRGCSSPANKDCDEDDVQLLIALYGRGHKDALRPLLQFGKDSDGALAEMLGEFYSEVLRGTPDRFLRTIRPWSRRTQAQLCEMAGKADGGGMSAKDLRIVSRKLMAIGSESALRCLQAVQKANKP